VKPLHLILDTSAVLAYASGSEHVGEPISQVLENGAAFTVPLTVLATAAAAVGDNWVELLTSHPAFEPHPIQGWTPDFIPLVLQEALDKKYYDERVPIAGTEGVKWAKALAQKEGIFTGISGGSTFAVALQVAEKAPAGSVVLCMLPDTGERYLSTPLFANITADMTEEELEISRSTPGQQFPAKTP